MIRDIAEAARKASRKLAVLSSAAKDTSLRHMAETLRHHATYLQEENARDLETAHATGLSPAMIDRLTLSEKVIEGMARGMEEIAELPDPVGRITGMARRPNGLVVGRMRIPLGVVAIIYESRPNVTADAAALCLKSGNAVILRGGSEAIHSNAAIVKILRESLRSTGIDPEAVGFIPVADRQAIMDMLRLEDLIDLVIPRGGEGLIRTVSENSLIPVLKHYKGVCHIFVDRQADLEKAYSICLNAKVQRPGVCNAMETLLVDSPVAGIFLPKMAELFTKNGVELRGCSKTRAHLPDIRPATEDDWYAEFLDLILAVKIVEDLHEAIDHIEKYGSNHTEAIITENYTRAMEFLHQVDSSTVLVNASTRFSDGGEFGLGAEVGISTSKIHSYGPMGIEDLTIQKFVCFGNGQIRQ
ncbi:MAG TPA: glutamate-5-semialdehyde dehydrogenase [Deltaproteobacteria bacterium]|jgi:glutamate-5-semialdehyde dehydrogenase|nr:glutamate-5-semialdehyde dehydrogenase [Deltaproteobacteria bacterium]HNQ85209.1 glutamate-5-semialdehyde dehydrogenase [Deltaproteobacteria bacterium]HNS90434.1 glutamate-5-semialdehyde dehydrogenase [Deltaproteobacteria bacterium]HOA43634.1 glutamate-5-semialdehyde dehydrogenase [Deltaproteobacteria bacterium]HOC75179.1 glutamate-5-semialdehyde dehydrogenase [Deltaproteobacteria bacterium]